MKYKVTLTSETDIENQEYIYVRVFDENNNCKHLRFFTPERMKDAEQLYNDWIEYLTINDGIKKITELKSTIIE
jgi:hypothetical protein